MGHQFLAASACNTAIDFLFHIFGIRLRDSRSNRFEGEQMSGTSIGKDRKIRRVTGKKCKA
jgi:hypothetical protein